MTIQNGFLTATWVWKYSAKLCETGLGFGVRVKGCHSVCLTHSSSSRRRGPWCRTASSSSCQACWGPAGRELRGAGRQHASGRPGRSPPRRGPVRSHYSWTRGGRRERREDRGLHTLKIWMFSMDMMGAVKSCFYFFLNVLIWSFLIV